MGAVPFGFEILKIKVLNIVWLATIRGHCTQGCPFNHHTFFAGTNLDGISKCGNRCRLLVPYFGGVTWGTHQTHQIAYYNYGIDFWNGFSYKFDYKMYSTKDVDFV